MCNLYGKSIHNTDAFRAVRIGSCRLYDDKQLKAQGGGSCKERQDTVKRVSIKIFKLFENQSISLANTFTSAVLMLSVSGWDKSLKKHIDVPFFNKIA